jgi:hypothetical protein
LLATSGGAGDDQRADKVDSPDPVLNSIAPLTIVAGGADLELDLSGEGFVAESKVQVLRVGEVGDVMVLATVLVTSTSLKATVPAAMLAEPGRLEISVANPEPGGGESETKVLLVMPAGE